MVHDFEKIISHKIRMAEQVPIPWQKDRVWQNIEWKSSKSRSLYFYYAAASIIIASTLTAYFLIKTVHEQSNLRIQSLETAISNQLKSRQETQHVTAERACETTTVQGIPANSIQRHTTQLNATAKVEPQLDIPMLNEEPEEALVVVDIQIPTDTGQQDQAHQPVIEAIIGFIPPTQEKTNVVKMKKMKFKFFNGNEAPLPGGSAEDNASVLTARIN